MHVAYKISSRLFDVYHKILARLRAKLFFLLRGLRFKRLGESFKIFGAEFVTIGDSVGVGRFCWIEGVGTYGGVKHKPSINIGNGVNMSDFVHLSAVGNIHICDGVLIGSNVYIGDHSHGRVKFLAEELLIPPAHRPLGEAADIYIGENVWICDGVVILGGSRIACGSIIAANSVVRLVCEKPAIIGGSPAKVIKYVN